MARPIFVENEYYHIFNRGVEKRDVYLDHYDYLRFIQSVVEFNSTMTIGSIFENAFRQLKSVALGSETPKIPLVSIVAYCLNSNHYHMLLIFE